MKHAEILEPLPRSAQTATLVLQSERVSCQIIEELNGKIIVAIPGMKLYEGQSRLNLKMNHKVIPVKLTLQEARAGGCLFELMPVEQPNTEVKARAKWTGLSRHFSIAGLVAVAVATLLSIPYGLDHHPLLSMRGIRKEGFGWWPASVSEQELVPPAISVDQGLVARHRPASEIVKVRADLPGVSISMISTASRIVTTELREPSVDSVRDDNGTNADKSNQPRSLKTLLAAGQGGRVQSVTPKLVPWLYGETDSDTALSLRMSDAAWTDLKHFAAGLNGLPTNGAAQAVTSLRQALNAAEQGRSDAKCIAGLSDIFVVRTDDADVYFRTVRGQAELVRILPLDFSKAD